MSLLRNLLDKIEEYLAGITLLGIAVFVFAQVISRHVIHRSFSFTEEIVRYLLVWTVFLGAAAATRRGAHLGIKFISRKYGGRVALLVALICGVATASLFTIVFFSGVAMLKLQIETGQRTPGLAWHVTWATSSVVVGALLILSLIHI